MSKSEPKQTTNFETRVAGSFVGVKYLNFCLFVLFFVLQIGNINFFYMVGNRKKK